MARMGDESQLSPCFQTTSSCTQNNDRMKLSSCIVQVIEDPFRAENILQKCLTENVRCVETLRRLDSDGRKQLGFRLGDIIRLESIFKNSTDEAEDLAAVSRKQHVQKLIGDIKQKLNPKAKRTDQASFTHGRHKKHKLYIGWRHYRENQYKGVRLLQGGGVRSIEYDVDIPQSVGDLIKIGKSLFFQDGESSFGQLKDMEVQLGSFAGKPVEQFCNKEGIPCSFQEYLQCRGLFASKHNVYLLTKLCKCVDSETSLASNDPGTSLTSSSISSIGNTIQPSQTNKEITTIPTNLPQDILTFNSAVPQIPIYSISKLSLIDALKPVETIMNVNHSKLNVKYLMETESSYTEVRTRLTCHSLADCQGSSFTIEALEAEYNPLTEGFKVISIMKDGQTYLDMTYDDEDKPVYLFPKMVRLDSQKEENVFFHGPDEIYGYEDNSNQFLLGAVASCHNQRCEYIWFKDGSEYSRGENLSLLQIQTTGVYSVGVQINELLLIHHTAVRVDDKSNMVSPQVIPENVCNNLPLFQSTCFTRQEGLDVSCPTADETMLNFDPQAFLAKPLEQSTPKCSVDLSLSQSELGASNKHKCTADSGLVSAQACQETNESSTETINVNIPLIQKSDINMGNVKHIGEGSFGRVYTAEWMGTPVAVKQIEIKRVKLLRNILHGEVQLHERARHPNIVQLMAYAIDKSSVYILSEYIGGPNLDDLLFGHYDGPSLSFPEKLVLSTQVLQGLAYIHNLNPPIIHQDIKPENIIVQRQNLVAKLCDFGVSRVKAIESSSTTANSNINQPGTPLYQAPEILLMGRRSSRATDVWSTACTLIELLTEKSVWCIEDMQSDQLSVMDHVTGAMKREEPPPAIAILSEEVPNSIRMSLIQGFSYDQSKRPSALHILGIYKSHS